jgi:hypothetical protein
MSHTAHWSASEWFAAIGCALIVSSIGPGAYVVVKKGKRRRMTHQEIKERILNDDITDMPTWSAAGPGVGVKVEASANTDTLRNYAARGEWGLFLSWSLTNIGWTSGFSLLFLAMLLESDAPIIAWVAGIVLVAPFPLVALFMPFAALFTKIDEGADDDVVEMVDYTQRR